MKNADVIRRMDDENLANFLRDLVPDDCEYCVADDVCNREESCVNTILMWLQMDDIKRRR